MVIVDELCLTFCVSIVLMFESEAFSGRVLNRERVCLFPSKGDSCKFISEKATENKRTFGTTDYPLFASLANIR